VVSLIRNTLVTLNPERVVSLNRNQVVSLSGISNITEQKKIQEKIYNDGQNLRAIINNTRDLIWSVDRQSNIIKGNQPFWDRVKELTGKDEDEVTNADFIQERVIVFFESYERAFRGEAFSIVRQREMVGRQIYEEISFNPIRNRQQEVTGVNCFLRDITRQHEHVAQIEKQNDKLREIAWLQSHKMRVPVANILGLAELFQLDDAVKDDIIPLLSLEAKRLDELIREVTVLTQDLDEPG